MARNPSKRSAPAKEAAPGPAIKIRMYRHGLGDCFLLTLPKDDGQPFYLMIDCGVVLGTTEPALLMQNVVKSIIADTNGKVDLLVVTHGHWDHVSGFIQAQDLFAPEGADDPAKLKVDQLWLAWTEDPNDPLASRLARERAERIDKLNAFVAGSSGSAMTAADEDVVSGVRELLTFFGAAGGKTTSDALKVARALTSKVRYVRPSDAPVSLPGISGLRIFALGPPQKEEALRKTDSRTEVYREFSNQGATGAFFAAVTDLSGSGELDRDMQDEVDRNLPFDNRFVRHLPRGDTASSSITPGSFFDRQYFGPSSDPNQPDQSWRRIDGDWTAAAAEFALQLDSATNNTSLVLAIECLATSKVLMFVADAQVGNWLSWADLSWTFTDAPTVTGEDLLKRTVFYKVGHHGSHNATLKAKGLELMRSDEFVAFIPVNHDMAVKKRWGKMPLPKLVDALREKARGRLVRLDEDFVVPQNDDGTAAAFAKQLTQTKLFYEWVMLID